YQYSLWFVPNGEPLNDFILNRRAAHCQYFASALAIMARAVGVPSRYVLGFYAHEPYGSNAMIVRQRDAHAWTECWIDPIGWMTFDATPSTGRPDKEFAELPAWRRWWEKLNDLPHNVRVWIGEHTRWIQVAVAIGAGIGAIVYLFRFFRRTQPTEKLQSTIPPPSQELLELARRFDMQLRKRGVICAPATTWRSVLSPPRQLGELFDRFINTYNHARFGGQTRDAITAARTLLERIETSEDRP
ncbi:MAG: transglutaminase domain-containing protein, partial [Phycisphaerae bacterium]|nr:transglutaminase domain-containing protein [Phycisphaerae bacterium]